jgi:ubiquitin-like modifier-activating enzyme ATG7
LSQIWQRIISGDADTNPMYLAQFLVLTYADLKKHKFYYWFAFPAFLPTSSWGFVDNTKPVTVGNVFSTAEVSLHGYSTHMRHDSGLSALSDGEPAI